MSGKWQKFRGKLTRFEQEKPYQAKVEAAKAKLLELPAGQTDADFRHASVAKLAAMFAQVRARKSVLEESLYATNIELEALSQLLVSALEGEDVQKVELASGATVYLRDSIYGRIVDRAAIMAWLKKQKMESLLSINYQTATGLCAERLQNGMKIPDGMEVFLKTEARILNGKCAGEEE